MKRIYLGATAILLACESELPTENAKPDFAVNYTPMVIAAGDIADCGRTQDNATGDLIRTMLASYPNSVVAALGDDAYPSGSASDFANCYQPAWGSFKSLTRPTVGNHEYDVSSTAQPYFSYFGANAGPAPKGYYSYDIGNWHIVVLNSNSGFQSTKAGSAQDNWLVADLAANTRPCILAYFHHPRFASSTTDTVIAPLDGATANLWQRLYAARADIILNGHMHRYERFYPLRPDGTRDTLNGIRQFTVGTGGEAQGVVKKVHPQVEVQAPNNTYGVLKITLYSTGYFANFWPIPGQTFTDKVSVPKCH